MNLAARPKLAVLLITVLAALAFAGALACSDRSEPTPTPEPTEATLPAEFMAKVFDGTVTWQDLLDALDPDQQACVQFYLQGFVDFSLDARILEFSFGAAAMFRCLPDGPANALFFTLLTEEVPNNLMTAEDRHCVDRQVEDYGIGAMVETLALGPLGPYSDEYVTVSSKLLKCVPGLLLAALLDDAGVTAEDVSDEVVQCMGLVIQQAIDDNMAAWVAATGGDVHFRGAEVLFQDTSEWTISNLYLCSRDDFIRMGISGFKTEESIHPTITQHFVGEALRRYERDGLDATLEYYNSPDSVDGQWYVFIVGEDGTIIGHYDPDHVGLDVASLEDSEGYLYGPATLWADEKGRWASFVHLNPETGEVQRRHSWVVRRDGLIFGSGWYE